ncbi:MAG: amidohydrolase [bacterium]|nr:amidohydrolase [bacterium]
MRYCFRLITLILILTTLVSATAFAQRHLDRNRNEAIQWVEDNKEMLNQAAKNIWDYEETALLEYRSAEELANLLEKNGFTVERGVAFMPTAFVATYGSGEPVIGILAEYDALPGLSQKSGITTKEALNPGNGGHGCGHNIFGVASSASAIAIKEIMEKRDLKGTIKLFGCPAEETVVGKVYMAKEGLFDDLDLCFDWHPGSRNSVGLGTSNAMNNFEVTFYGKTAHSAGDPWNGNSALDAVELMNIGVNYLREHVIPTVRIHYVIPEAGKAPNVVPDYTKVWYYVRDKDRQGVDLVYDKVLKIAEGAALMTGTTHEVYMITGVYNYLKNRKVAEVIHRNLEIVGPPPFTQEEQEFAMEIQRNLEKDEDGLHGEIVPLQEPKGYLGGGSTDVADVSWIVPTASLSTACWPQNAPGHSWVVTTCSGSSIGFKGMQTAAKTLAASGIEVLMNKDIIKEAQEEFQEKTKDFIYKSSVPEGQKARLPEKKRNDDRR